MHYRLFKSVLIANRGEIAARIVKEAKAAGITAIAAYSDADRKSWFVQDADAAIHIGPSAAAESYLNIPRILAAAKAKSAEAIHPGYGFLSENPEFAQAVIDSGLVWIGPSPSAIRAMGDKGNAKDIARRADVPVIPGYDGDDQSDARLLAEAKKIGWPVLIKAALGGGGRGQRKVAEEATFLDALASARREALSAFASERMILEKALENVRHIEVQIFGDSHGNVIHLGERDCSVQRRNQKIIEEAPALGVSEELRNLMGASAIALAKAVNYTNAGTVEYLLDASGNFYFLEMNTRIQVEHPVTEEVTGTNLIQWQFDVAAGKPLPLSQNEVRITGHAIEARLCAEDPDQGFAPQIGDLDSWSTPRWARVDYGLQWNATIPAEYDSLIAKIIGRGPTREDARQQLVRALEDGHALGVKTNRNYLLQVLELEDFVAGTFNLGILASHPGRTVPALETEHASIAALLLAFGEKGGWSSSGIRTSSVTLRAGSSTRTFRIENGTVNGMELLKTDCEITPWSFTARDESGEFTDFFMQRGTHIHLNWARTDEVFEDVTYAPAERKDAAGAGAVRAPMAGKIIKVATAAGATVTKGDLLVVLEAMKMEHELRAATDGTIDTISIKPGDQVAMRQLLIAVKSA